MAQITKLNSKRSWRRRGLTMIETLVATLIITVSMLGAVGVFFSATTLTGLTSQASTAASLAREAIE